MRTDSDDLSETAARCQRGDWAMTVDGLTVRCALHEAGLDAPARFYPEWVCAEAFLLVLLRTGGRLPSATVYRRAGEVGLRRAAIQRARVRLGIISTRQRGIRPSNWTWTLPCELTTDAGRYVVLHRWQRMRDW